MNIRGRKIDPSDFERILFTISGLRKGCFVTFGIDDPVVGTQGVVLISEVKAASKEAFETICRNIRKQVLLRLGLTIHELILVRAGLLAKTSSGKRRHRYFRQLYLEGKINGDCLYSDTHA